MRQRIKETAIKIICVTITGTRYRIGHEFLKPWVKVKLKRAGLYIMPKLSYYYLYRTPKPQFQYNRMQYCYGDIPLEVAIFIMKSSFAVEYSSKS